MANSKTEVFRFMSIRPPKPQELNEKTAFLIKDTTEDNYAKLVSVSLPKTRDLNIKNRAIKNKIVELKDLADAVIIKTSTIDNIFNSDFDVEYEKIKKLVDFYRVNKRELSLIEFIRNTDCGSFGHSNLIDELNYVNGTNYNRKKILSKLLNTLYFERITNGDKRLIEYLTDAILCLEIYYKGLNDYNGSKFKIYDKFGRESVSDFAKKMLIEMPPDAFPVHRRSTTPVTVKPNPEEILRQERLGYLAEYKTIKAKIQQIEDERGVNLKFKSVYDDLKNSQLQSQSSSNELRIEEFLEKKQYFETREKSFLEQAEKYLEKEKSFLKEDKQLAKKEIGFSDVKKVKFDKASQEIEFNKKEIDFTEKYSEFQNEKLAFDGDYLRLQKEKEVFVEEFKEEFSKAAEQRQIQIPDDGKIRAEILKLPQVLSSEEYNRFTYREKTIIKDELQVNVNYLEISYIKKKVQQKIDTLTALVARNPVKKQLFIGNSLVDLVPDKLTPVEEDDNTDPIDPNQEDYSKQLKTLKETTPDFEPMGVGDLLVVKKKLLKYKEGEIAHIENILKSEHKNRTHRRTQRSEENYSYETELMTETQKDTQSTERFDLKNETSRVLDSQKYDDKSVNASASYGPVSASADKSWGDSQSVHEANKQSNAYAKEVTERAMERVVTQVKERRSTKVIAETEEINTHGFDNSKGTGHITGLYYWLDKYYKAQTYNYGKRLMYKFNVPGPGKRYLEQKAKEAEVLGNLLMPPEEPMFCTHDDHKKEQNCYFSGVEVDKHDTYLRKLLLTDITRDNYLNLCAKYGVENFELYPEERIFLNESFKGEGTSSQKIGFSKDFEIKIPEEYTARAWSYKINYTGGYRKASRPVRVKKNLEIRVGGSSSNIHSKPNVINNIDKIDNISQGAFVELNFENHTETEDKLPVSVLAYKSSIVYTLSVIIFCEIKEGTYLNWQKKVYNSIMSAYEKQKAEYEEKLRELEAGVNIEGTNPTDNRRIEKEEIKRSCIELITGFDFSQLGQSLTVNEDDDTITIDVEKAKEEGEIISFFENAFEWDQMLYKLSPYFWTKSSNWYNIQQIKDKDILFQNFLRSSGAEVTLAIKKGYEKAVMHFMCTNQLWDGKTIANIGSVDGKPLDDLLNEIETAPEQREGEAVGEPWIIKLPTDLIYLSKDMKLITVTNEFYNISFSADKDKVEPGDNVTFNVSVTNIGEKAKDANIELRCSNYDTQIHEVSLLKDGKVEKQFVQKIDYQKEEQTFYLYVDNEKIGQINVFTSSAVVCPLKTLKIKKIDGVLVSSMPEGIPNEIELEKGKTITFSQQVTNSRDVEHETSFVFSYTVGGKSNDKVVVSVTLAPGETKEVEAEFSVINFGRSGVICYEKLN